MRLLLALILATAAGFAQELVTIDSGTLQGKLAIGAWSYKNIPFAAPPVGDLRLRPPQPPQAWPDTRDARSFGPLCPQLDSSAPGGVAGSEDCLQLNVWVPEQGNGPYPVLFWIPGGGNLTGGAPAQSLGAYTYDGASLAVNGNLAVVTVNYRLGPLGFLAHPSLTSENDPPTSGNYAILDLIAALQWVQRNIAQFGGDPSRVTIDGESAGAVNVCTLIATPLAAGLFQSAIMSSGGCVGSTQQAAYDFGQQVFDKAKCADPACLRGLTVNALLKALPQTTDLAAPTAGAYGAVVDQYVLNATPLATIAASAHNQVPVIIGSNSDETSQSVPTITTEAQYKAAILTLFPFPALADAILELYPSTDYATPQKALVAVTTDAKFLCLGTRRSANTLRDSQSAPVYRYVFSHGLEGLGPAFQSLGAWHGLDVLFLFRDLSIAGYRASPGELQLSSDFQRFWSQLAASNLSPGNGADWPVYDRDSETYLQLDTTLQTGQQYRQKYCAFWDAILGSSVY